jgi:hypothetical protein
VFGCLDDLERFEVWFEVFDCFVEIEKCNKGKIWQVKVFFWIASKNSEINLLRATKINIKEKLHKIEVRFYL